MLNLLFLLSMLYFILVMDMDLRDVKEFIKDFIKIAILVIIVFFVYFFIVGMQQVVGSSMNNTLVNEDFVIVDKISYKIGSIKRFDIISFYYDETKYLIKRVIGLPGEHIAYKDNQLYVNGELVSDKRDFVTEDFDLKEIGYDVIPNGYYFVLGDNREDSLDSRDIGLVKEEEIIGKAIIRIWPLNKFKIIN